MTAIESRTDPLLYADDTRARGDDPLDLIRECRAGRLIRVRRGAYCPREVWDPLPGEERHVLAARAVARRAALPFAIAGPSAAAVWGMPGAARWPDDVTMAVPYRGGGSSASGVRRTAIAGGSVRSQLVDGIPVTSIARTAIDLARASSSWRGVAVLDWALRTLGPGVGAAALAEELARAGGSPGFARIRRALELADAASESVGESRARVVIHELGFAPPVLQARFSDREGDMWVDFHWPSVSVVAEFDGHVKYADPAMSGGDPAAVLWREKKREDRLRRQVRRVERILWRHLDAPQELAAILAAAGVPRLRAQTSEVFRRPPRTAVRAARDMSIAEGHAGRVGW
ncbi:type IV toxin-antitoxin system AbiEi family antitoxin [Homoserinibacter sp. YIM 151385]|uniref:type IV toxin-antitoxin system AbiEi family antitoxin n=1 Tax=Homoserinibacter sp. YIM 151385 TaxID=2985506 RepID=UPI0022F03303|nr:hypothetical protein [Homoserinibacter sp. YIM 151385]WBU37727.1 hypothetical protein OF852_12535 [Homoserinibacter sp. YIM 151385]